MSRFDKLIDKILKLDKNLRFDELCKAIKSIGYDMKSPRGGSSHATFRKDGKMPITIPRDYPIDKVYIQLVRDIILESEVD